MSDRSDARRSLTYEEKLVCLGWARQAADNIVGTLEDYGIENVDDEGFADALTECLNDIALANAERVKEGATPEVKP